MDEAAAPAYLECKDARVGLIGACSTLGKNLHAGIPRGDMSGPGANPLGFETRYNVTAAQIEQRKLQLPKLTSRMKNMCAQVFNRPKTATISVVVFSVKAKRRE